MPKKPLIGLTSDLSDDKKYSQSEYCALRNNYIKSIIKAGGIPLILPPNQNDLNEYANLIDGLILTGGHFDITPNFYQEDFIHKETIINTERADFEIALLKLAFERKIPIFGICGGMQLINVFFGGSLYQHIPDYIKTNLQHELRPYSKVAHQVLIDKNSKLAQLIELPEKIGVNSSHHQAIKKLSPDFNIAAKASDGVIEAIEYNNSDYSFLIGVQWHPEYQVNQYDLMLFKKFIESCLF